MTLLANLLNIFEGPQGIFILLIILLLFGAKKLPELARGMGKAIKEFQKAKDEFGDELHKGVKSDVETSKSGRHSCPIDCAADRESTRRQRGAP